MSFLRVCGHQRSGNHYLAALIAQNFFNSNDNQSVFDNNTHSRLSNIMCDIKYIYIFRDPKSVLNSVFKLRQRFGLCINNYDDFLNHSYKRMFNKNLPCNVIFRTLTREQIITNVDYFFLHVDFAPAQWHTLHLSHWFNLSKVYKNILLVEYKLLINHFSFQMDIISEFLGFTKRHNFTNISKKLGWFLPPGR